MPKTEYHYVWAPKSGAILSLGNGEYRWPGDVMAKREVEIEGVNADGLANDRHIRPHAEKRKGDKQPGAPRTSAVLPPPDPPKTGRKGK